jgi:predicted N-acyltransferase
VTAVLRGLPKPLSRIRQLKGLFCGLPGSPGQNSLAVTSADALAALDQAIGEVATRIGADVIVYKEFGNEDLPRMDRLVEFGYRRIPTQPMHFLKPGFPDFGHYCAALSSNYRKSVNRSTRKLKPAGAEVNVFTDSDEILRVYTPDVHALYYQMVGKAEVNIELLPIEFFRQLTSRLKGHVELVTIIKEARIVAIGWCLNVGSAFHLMYAGLDYQLNRELDLYFNLMYAALDRALRSGAAKIHVGQTASAFKARLGCHAESLYGYIKGRGLLMWPLVRFGADLVLSQMPTSPPADIFRKECGK